MPYGSRSRSDSSSSVVTAREWQSEDSSDDYDLYAPTRFTSRRSSKRERIQDLKKRTKSKTKRFLHLGGGVHDNDHGDQDDHDVNLESDPAFNPGLLGEMANPETHHGGGGEHNKGLGSFQKVLQTISHPRHAIKTAATRTTAGILSTAEHPHVSQRSDYEFLQEHCHVARADDSKDFPDSTTDGYLETAKKLERHRESMRVAWITGAHVDRVRVPRRAWFEFPDRSAFQELDEDGNLVRYRWEKWIGCILLYYTQDFSAQYIDDSNELPFDLGRLKSHLERLVMASAPWQAWCMHIRRVFRWEDPVETGRWLFVYAVVWYTQNMMAFVWGYIIYMVLRNRQHPSSLESLQESMKRNLERGSMAYRLGELIDKHGREDWLGPLIDDVGPMVQLQLGDLANLLEVFANFYAWKSPQRTAYTVFLLSTCLTVALVADMKFCMKVFWFVSGCGFFFSWPISSRYPKYRYLVSPFKWILWDVPTHAEWSFQYLRQKAQYRREEIIEQKVEEKSKENRKANHNTLNGSTIHHEVDQSDEFLKSNLLTTTPCTYDHHSGELGILSSGLVFNQLPLIPIPQRKPRKHEIWHRPFLDLAEMRKVIPSNHKQDLFSKKHKLKTLKQQKSGIELFFTDGTKVAVEMRDARIRDQAFNLIIGHSGWRWQ